MIRSAFRCLPCVLVIGACWVAIHAQSPSPVDTGRLGEMRWRMIGPHRGGRTRPWPASPASRTRSSSASSTAASGRPPTPAARGCRSSTTSRPARSARSPSRRPIRTSSTSAAARACSVRISPPATACTSRSNGGQTWTHLGLRDGQQIAHIVVDPANPDRLFVAVLGHPTARTPSAASSDRLDGGQTFQKVLYKDENTGGSMSRSIPKNPNTSTPCSGRRGKARGRTAIFAGRAAASSSRPTAARRGGR